MAVYALSFDKLVNSDFAENSTITPNVGGNGSTYTGIVVFKAFSYPFIVDSAVPVIGSIKVGGGNLLTETAKFYFEFGTYNGSSFSPISNWTNSFTVSEGTVSGKQCNIDGGTYSFAKGTRFAYRLTVSSTEKYRVANTVMSAFGLELYGSIQSYTLEVKTNNDSYGTVSGGGTYEYGKTAELTATAKTGYKFKQWSDGNTDNPRTVTVTGTATYTAVFEEVCELRITSPGDKGTITGATDKTYFEKGSVITFTATANKGYKFDAWAIFVGEEYSQLRDNPLVYTINANTTISALFVEAPPEITSVTITRSSDLAKVTINTPVDAGAKYIISVEVT